MRVSDIPGGSVRTLTVRPIGGWVPEPARAGEEVALRLVPGVEEVVLEIGDRVGTVAGVDTRDCTVLMEITGTSLPSISWLASNGRGAGGEPQFLIQVHRFPLGQFWPDAAEFGVDEKILKDARRRSGAELRTVADVCRWLGDAAFIPPRRPGHPWRAILSASPDGPSGQESAFRLHGHRVDVHVRRTDEGKLLVERLAPPATRKGRVGLTAALVTSPSLSFRDATLAGKFRAEALSQMDELVQRTESYLRIWKEYSRIEWETIIRRAREFGWVRYQGYAIDTDGRCLFQLVEAEELDSQLEYLFSLDKPQVEAAADLPPEILDPDGESADSEGDSSRDRGQAERPRFAGSVERPGHGERWTTLRVRPLGEEEGDSPPPDKGFLFLAVHGDRVRQKRRDTAFRLVREVQSAMPQLGLLLEGRPIPSVRRKRESPLSPAVRKIFGGEPTVRQIEALEVALNTPDIALIQGPPGTGKTKIIAALSARLAEIDRREGSEVAGRVFLGSESRNAVAHAASGTEVLGLPAVNLSGRGSDGVNLWRRRQEDRISALLASRPSAAGDPLRRVQALQAGFINAPGGPSQSAEVLRQVDACAGLLIPAGLRDRIRQRGLELRRLSSMLEGQGSQEKEAALRAVRSLRTAEESFPDGGRDNAYRAMSRLIPLEILTPDEQQLLDRASREEPPGSGLLAACAALKNQLLARLNRPRSITGAAGVDVTTQALLAEVIDVLYARVRGSRAGIDAVLERYLDDLRNDPHGVRQAIRAYTVVLADTIQKAAGKNIRRLKSDDVVFDTVIIDEAARANPLDLLIPMTRAVRRIVLVGDHRQLPHLLEPDVERELERSVLEEARENLRKSLFWRLFALLKAREAEDGIRRVVTLNTQYRMHPLLGRFVSRIFYEPHNDACIEPGRVEEEFQHGLPGFEGKVAAWIDVPRDRGQETRGRSKSRPPEARRLAEELRRLVDAAPEFTFGVITFYAAQAQAIWRALADPNVGLAEEQEDGSYQIASAFQGPDEERIRVGTVDAFQGVEFDVVFLSLTRSNDLAGDGELGRRRKYGHLLLENRLCVAMSRQKRLLIVVGDRAMIRDEGVEGLRPLLLFDREMCGEPYGIRI